MARTMISTVPISFRRRGGMDDLPICGLRPLNMRATRARRHDAKVRTLFCTAGSGKSTPVTGAEKMSVTTATAYRSFNDPDKIERNRRQVRRWLGFVLFLLFCLVLVGGATRLTGSGLSITQWKPIHGVIPPLSVSEWQEEFELYKRIPQYEHINKGMSVEEFKVIFWWEWA